MTVLPGMGIQAADGDARHRQREEPPQIGVENLQDLQQPRSLDRIADCA